MVFKKLWNPEKPNRARDNPNSVIIDLVKIVRELQEQFTKLLMCHYLEGHKGLDGDQYAFVELCQGHLISFHSRWGDDTGHVNKEEERDTIAKAKLAILFHETRRYNVVRANVKRGYDL